MLVFTQDHIGVSCCRALYWKSDLNLLSALMASISTTVLPSMLVRQWGSSHLSCVMKGTGQGLQPLRNLNLGLVRLMHPLGGHGDKGRSGLIWWQLSVCDLVGKVFLRSCLLRPGEDGSLCRV